MHSQLICRAGLPAAIRTTPTTLEDLTEDMFEEELLGTTDYRMDNSTNHFSSQRSSGSNYSDQKSKRKTKPKKSLGDSTISPISAASPVKRKFRDSSCEDGKEFTTLSYQYNYS